ncbi:MAG: OmpA family protein [Marinilabiliaceae bacterium]|nr:OmpA family protein [Marinilabiliaceae bacterium]
MKKINFYFAFLLSIAVVLSGCKSMSNTAKGGVIGGASGAIVGAGIGAIAGDKKGAVIGAAVGTAVGTTAGILIGKKMDKQKEELEKIEGAKVESVKDVNNLDAIKVTFDSGILFATGKSRLSSESKAALTNFAASLKNNPQTDVAIYGHTDNTGSREVNERISLSRAESVASFLKGKDISRDRMTVKGLAYDQPVADNSTEEGRAQNRRVEVYISADETMIKEAESGTLK